METALKIEFNNYNFWFPQQEKKKSLLGKFMQIVYLHYFSVCVSLAAEDVCNSLLHIWKCVYSACFSVTFHTLSPSAIVAVCAQLSLKGIIS